MIWGGLYQFWTVTGRINLNEIGSLIEESWRKSLYRSIYYYNMFHNIYFRVLCSRFLLRVFSLSLKNLETILEYQKLNIPSGYCDIKGLTRFMRNSCCSFELFFLSSQTNAVSFLVELLWVLSLKNQGCFIHSYFT